VAIHVKDLNLNRDQVQVLTDGETLVSAVVPPRVEEEPEPVVVEGEELEGEGAEGEGAEPGEGGEASEGSSEGASENSSES
jgi:hypothetical protein